MEHKNIKADTIIRTVVLIVALINQALAVLGRSPLPFDDVQIEQLVSSAVTIAVSIWTWWKNNSFTQAAIRADEQMVLEKEVLK